MRKLLSRFRYHIAIFFAVLGPGFITAVVDNDAGGILTYSQAGARFGYLPLWTLLPITLALIVKGNYRSVEKIFLFSCVVYVTYIISGVLVKPDWKEAAVYSVKPVLMLD